jgi:hypothetical protein
MTIFKEIGKAFHKDGCITTQSFEYIPGANMDVAIAHAAAGNEKEAARASAKGFST